jgi:alpha-amylase/alpha-mannosidase (GH57 family)
LAKGRGFTEEEKRALLDWGVALCGTVAGAYRTAAAAGQVELATSAHQHPILPLLVDSDAPREASPTISLPSPPFRAPDDAVAQVRRARDSHARRFGAPPRGTWPPEGAVCDRTVAILAGEGFAWAASDESVLASALRARDGGLNAWPAALYRAYAAATPSGPLAMLFRDRRLSDAIGFVYKHWDAARAAEDFLDRVRRAGETATGGGPALVTVILDGENCWEAYSEDGRPFLTALYGALEKNSAIEAVTVSEALRRAPPVERLPRVPVGSWIRDDLAIWIGHPEKNRAWTELRRAREALVERGLAAPPEAWEALYAAEASDWFWWYGDDHESSHKDSFDTLFRANVRSVYGLLGVAEPASLAASLRAARDTPRAPGEVAFLKPTIDGRETDFFEWRNAARYDAAASGGAAHPVAGAMARVLHGIDERSLFVRIDPASGAELGGASVAIRFADSGRAARVPIDGRESGHPEWAGQGVGEEGGGDAGAYARGVVVEARLPLSRCGAAPGAVLRWRVVLSRGGAVEETAPRDGWFETAIPPDDLRLRLWSAT